MTIASVSWAGADHSAHGASLSNACPLSVGGGNVRSCMLGCSIPNLHCLTSIERIKCGMSLFQGSVGFGELFSPHTDAASDEYECSALLRLAKILSSCVNNSFATY